MAVYAIYAAVAFGVNFFAKRANLDISLCAFKEFTGHPCATCGGTRAAVRLAHLDLVGAIEYNPLATVALFTFAAWLVVAFVRAGRPLIRWTKERRTAMAACVVAALLINWVYVWRAEPQLTARDQAARDQAHPRQSDQPRPFSIPR